MSQQVDYGAWWSYSFQRLGGLELGTSTLASTTHDCAEPDDIPLTSFGNRRDRVRFIRGLRRPGLRRLTRQQREGVPRVHRPR